MLTTFIKFLKKHNERATIIGLGFGLVVFVVSGIYLQKKNSQEKEIVSVKEPTTVKIQVSPKTSSKGNEASSQKTSSFFLHPSPVELLERLLSMENLQEDVAQSKLKNLPVLWPVFYFSVDSIEGRESLLLDVSEDGFGAQVRGDINSVDFPKLKELKGGEKIWVAGEILAVDPTGTGTVYLNIELLDFTEEGPSTIEIRSPILTD